MIRSEATRIQYYLQDICYEKLVMYGLFQVTPYFQTTTLIYIVVMILQWFCAEAGYSENHFLFLESLSSCPWLWSKGESFCNFLYLKSLSLLSLVVE